MGLHLAGDEIGFYSGVIVDTVTPTYVEGYQSTHIYNFEVTGEWLHNFSDNAKAYLSTSNNNPLEHEGSNYYDLSLISKTPTKALFRGSHQIGSPTYLGVIIDKGARVFVNNTRPIPD